MAIALNLTAPLKRDATSRRELQALKDSFAGQVQPLLDAALARSEVVHFARVVVIDDRYIQILTEFDGDPEAYTEFFRRELGPVFERVFALVKDAPPWKELNNADAFFAFTKGLDLPSLGQAAAADDPRGYLFSAVGDLTVSQIKRSLAAPPAA